MELRTLHLEQVPLPGTPTDVAGQLPVPGDDAVTGDEERDRIGRQSPPDRPCPLGGADGPRDLIEGLHVTGGDPLVLNASKLENIIRRLRDIEHVGIIRIGMIFSFCAKCLSWADCY